jgi:hypothetical protein
MLTDGEDTSRLDPLAVAQIAAQSGVRIYPIGVGSEAGTVVDIDGFSIATRLDEALLRQVAQATNGKYFQAENTAQLAQIYNGIDSPPSGRDDGSDEHSRRRGAAPFCRRRCRCCGWDGAVITSCA